MSAEQDEALRRENAYLKARCSQLEGDILDLQAELDRLRQVHGRLAARRPAAPPNPLGSGQ